MSSFGKGFFLHQKILIFFLFFQKGIYCKLNGTASLRHCKWVPTLYVFTDKYEKYVSTNSSYLEPWIQA